LADQRVAAFRLFLFCRPFIVRTVSAEAARIQNDAKLKEHMAFIWSSFAECVPDDDQIRTIERRAQGLVPFHPGEIDDCRILAEVEVCGVRTLATFDMRLQRRLTPHTDVCIQTPAECWESLAIPHGAAPLWSPAPEHPLSRESWWHW
jgi:hypothetical protein